MTIGRHDLLRYTAKIVPVAEKYSPVIGCWVRSFLSSLCPFTPKLPIHIRYLLNACLAAALSPVTPIDRHAQAECMGRKLLPDSAGFSIFPQKDRAVKDLCSEPDLP